MLHAAFTLLGTSVTWLEAVAFAFALACVVCNVYEIHWGWPLLVISSALYGWLFFVSRLYGDVAVQVYFALSSLWGWWEWVYGRRSRQGGQAQAPAALRVTRLASLARMRLLALWLLAWPLLGALLARYTDTDVPYFNGFPTAGSFIAQVLMGLKYIECWPVWIVVDLTSAVLYATKMLWLTSVLSMIFATLALIGWRRWRGTAPLAEAPSFKPEGKAPA
jgi:nicotinamide mononucleotide transporter